MKKTHFLIAFAAILSFTACKNNTTGNLPGSTERIQGEPYGVTIMGNDPGDGFITTFDELWDDGNGHTGQSRQAEFDSARVNFTALSSTYSVTSAPYVIVSDASGNLNSMPAANVAGFQGTKGTSTFSGLTLVTTYTVTHGLGYTPSQIILQSRSANAAALNWTSNYTSTTFRVNFLTIPVIGTNNITFDWLAIK